MSFSSAQDRIALKGPLTSVCGTQVSQEAITGSHEELGQVTPQPGLYSLL